MMMRVASSLMMMIAFACLSAMFLRASRSSLGPVSAPLRPVLHLLGLLFAAHAALGVFYVILPFAPAIQPLLTALRMGVAVLTIGIAYVMWEQRTFLDKVIGRDAR